MSWRKCLVRGLVFTALGAMLLGCGAYALWTDPSTVRGLVETQLGERFVHVAVHLDHARMRLLGGILIDELRMTRLDGLASADFLYVPTGVIYLDKEHMLEGKALVRKVELTRPELRLIRERDGRFNVAGILGPTDLNTRLPTVVLRSGTVTFEDRTLASTAPLLEIRDVNLTIVNDPLPTLHIEGSGKTDVLGPVSFRASVSRATFATNVQIDLPTIPIGAALVGRLAGICPEAGCLQQLTGLAEVHAKFQSYDEPTSPFSYEVSAHLRQGRYVHPQLPDALNNVDLELHASNGRVHFAKLSAQCGHAQVSGRVADFRIPESKDDLQDPHQLMRELDLSVEHFDATRTALDRLPEVLRFIDKDYSPSGPISVRYTYRQAGEGPLVKEWLIEPEGMDGSFIDFPYPLKQIQGKIRVDASVMPLLDVSLDLSAKARGQTVTVKGNVKGNKKTPEVYLDIRGTDLVLDDKILDALSPDKPAVSRAARVALQFLPEQSRLHGLAAYPMGKADFQALIRRSRGQERLDKRFTVSFKEASLKYDQFPYPLEKVSGILIVHSDHWECKNFRGSHAGAEVFVDGYSESMPDRVPVVAADGSEGSRPEIVRIFIRGTNLLLDRELEQALSPREGNERKMLQETWRTLGLSGRLQFSAEVVDHPNHPQDIDVNVKADGCTMKPAFFEYALDDMSGQVRYAQGRVYLRDIQARHGPASMSMKTGLIELKPGGGFLGWLRGITGRNVTPDRDLMQALPEGLRKGLEPLHLREPVVVGVALTIDSPPGTHVPAKVWWDGGVILTKASLSAGVDVTGANGEFYCRGCHDGKQLRGVFGDLLLHDAAVMGQPVSELHGRLEIQPDTPDVIRIRDIKASLYGGTIGGEARLDIGPILRYDLLLEALGVQLEQFARQNLGQSAGAAQLQGPARASLHLEGAGTDLLGLKGNGRVDVVQGKMGQLPVLLDLVKAFGLRVPDRTAFEQAHVDFAVEGPQLRVEQLDLYGNAISLRGQGTVDLNGSNLNLDFTATPGRFSQLLPNPIDAIPQVISQQFLKIKMRGKLGKDGDIRFDKELVPAVVEPIRRVLGGS